MLSRAEVVDEVVRVLVRADDSFAARRVVVTVLVEAALVVVFVAGLVSVALGVSTLGVSGAGATFTCAL